MAQAGQRFSATSRAELEELRRHAGEAATLLKTLASENRLLILCTLADGELSVGDLNDLIQLSQSGLSQQLAILRRDGLVATRRQSQAILYSLAPSNAIRVIEALKDIYCDRPIEKGRARQG